MKAKEYFAKYEAQMMKAGPEDYAVFGVLFNEMLKEVVEIVKLRKAKTNDAIFAVYQEMNQKWNALCVLFEKKYGVSPIKRNGFIELCKHESPEIKLFDDYQKTRKVDGV